MTPRAKTSPVHRVRARQRRRREMLVEILALAEAGQTVALGSAPQTARTAPKRLCETFSAPGRPMGRRAP